MRSVGLWARLRQRLAAELRRAAGVLDDEPDGPGAHESVPGGPPEHWLALVRARAPQLLEGRGIGTASAPRPPERADRVPSVPPLPAPDPAGDDTAAGRGRPAQRGRALVRRPPWPRRRAPAARGGQTAGPTGQAAARQSVPQAVPGRPAAFRRRPVRRRPGGGAARFGEVPPPEGRRRNELRARARSWFVPRLPPPESPALPPTDAEPRGGGGRRTEAGAWWPRPAEPRRPPPPARRPEAAGHRGGRDARRLPAGEEPAVGDPAASDPALEPEPARPRPPGRRPWPEPTRSRPAGRARWPEWPPGTIPRASGTPRRPSRPAPAPPPWPATPPPAAPLPGWPPDAGADPWPTLPDDADQRDLAPGLDRLDRERLRRLDLEQRGR